MRHQVLPATHPDGFYAVYQGTAYAAKTSTTDQTVLLIAADGETPDGFDKEYEGQAAAVVLDSEVPHTFSIHTRLEYADEVFALVEQSADRSQMLLAWTGDDPELAQQLGLEEFEGGQAFGLVSPTENVEGLWQERRDYFDRENLTEPEPGDPQDLLKIIGKTLREIQPADAAGIAAQFRQVGGYAELEVRCVADDIAYSLAPPPVLGQAFSDLRRAMYDPEKGPWYTGTFSLDADGQFNFDYAQQSQPSWRLAPDSDGRPTARAYAVELERFPREDTQVPPWLAARAGVPLDVEFRHARVVDHQSPGQRPVVDRPPVPPQELRGVLDYLYRSPVVQVGDGPQPDLFAPHTAPTVPHAFHSDGTWIWPAAVPHYLRLHGIAPEKELLDHIRANSYRPPFVSQKLRETAQAELAGEPYPPQSAEDLDERDAVTEVERDDTLRPRLRATDVLTLLRKRLDEQGVSRAIYSFGLPITDGWSLERVDNDWQVARYAAGQVRSAEYFDHITSAAAHLLGLLAFYPTRAMAGPDPQEAPTDWPVQPARGEPPLTLFRGKRLVVLPAGTVVVRFGPDGGNLVHEASVRFRETSLLPDREQQRREFRLTRPLRVLTGVTLPHGGMPGGALAYFLPAPVGVHLQSRALEPNADADPASAPVQQPAPPARQPN